MGRQIVRPALKDDAPVLAEVKSRYVRALYRGMLSTDYLKTLHETFYLEQIRRWLDGEYQIDVLEVDGEISGFIAYGTDPDDSSYGLIYEINTLPTCGVLDRDALMRSCLANLSQKHPLVRVHTARDNFRARFLFEQFGFRPDGYQYTRIIDDNELQVIRLIGHSNLQTQGV